MPILCIAGSLLEQQIQDSYNEAFGHPPSSAELSNWRTFFLQPVQLLHYRAGDNEVSPQRYNDLVQWHKDYMAKPEGKPTRMDVIKKSYPDSSLKKVPSQQEMDYWLSQPVYTYTELRQFHEDYPQQIALIEQQIQDSYREAFDKSPSGDEDKFWHSKLDETASLDHYKATGTARRYADLIQWHKDYMGTPEGKPIRLQVITKAYQDSKLRKTPTDAEVQYWLGQPVHTYKEPKEYCDNYHPPSMVSRSLILQEHGSYGGAGGNSTWMYYSTTVSPDDPSNHLFIKKVKNNSSFEINLTHNAAAANMKPHTETDVFNGEHLTGDWNAELIGVSGPFAPSAIGIDLTLGQ